MVKVDIGIVCAIKDEYVVLKNNLQNQQELMLGDKQVTLGYHQGLHIALIKSGIGNINAASATTSLIHVYDPDILFFSGIAGILNQDLNVGDVLVGENVFLAEGHSHEVLKDGWSSDLSDLYIQGHKDLLSMVEILGKNLAYKVAKGTIVSSDKFPAPENFNEITADVIDMETAAFYQVCKSFSKPCLGIRSGSNPVTDSNDVLFEENSIPSASHNASDFCFKLVGNLALEYAAKRKNNTTPLKKFSTYAITALLVGTGCLLAYKACKGGNKPVLDNFRIPRLK